MLAACRCRQLASRRSLVLGLLLDRPAEFAQVWEQLPDLREFSRAVEGAFRELLEAAQTHVVRLPTHTRRMAPRQQPEHKAAS